MIRPSYGLALVGFALFACDKGDKAPPPATSGSAALSAAPPSDASAPDAAPKKGAVTLITTWGKDVGLKTPECALHDETSDVYFVSNIDGKPLDADGKGFISKLAPEAMGMEMKFIEGGKKKVTLNAPKGMTLTGDTLWVADIDTVRTFDRKTGEPKGDVKIPGATFLNDMVTGADGTSVVVSDTGMKAGKDGKLEQAGTDAVYSIDSSKKVTTIAKTHDLGNPNGLYIVGDKIWVVTFGSNDLYALDAKGVKGAVTKLPKGQLDGLTMFGTDFLVSSWEGQAVYRGQPGGTFTAIIEGVKSPADIMFDKKRSRVIIPLFEEDEIRAYELK